MGWKKGEVYMASWRRCVENERTDVDEIAQSEREESGRKWERMTDGKGRGRWEGENKSRGARCGGDEPKNVREPERVVGWLRCRVESNFLPHDLDSTAGYLNPDYSTLLFIFHIIIPLRPCRLFGHLPSPLLLL